MTGMTFGEKFLILSHPGGIPIYGEDPRQWVNDGLSERAFAPRELLVRCLSSGVRWLSGLMWAFSRKQPCGMFENHLGKLEKPLFGTQNRIAA